MSVLSLDAANCNEGLPTERSVMDCAELAEEHAPTAKEAEEEAEEDELWVREPHAPPMCAATMGDCLESHCCADPRAFGCFHRPNKHFAQCLPLSHMHQADGTCTDSEEWLCPSTWLSPPPPPAAPSPPPVIAGCVGTEPSEPYAACYESRARPALAITASRTHMRAQ